MNSNILYKTAFLSLVSILFQGFLIAQEEVIEETVVISAKYPVPLSEVIGSVDSISLRDIESRQVSDLRDLLDNTIGVSVTKDVYAGRTFNDVAHSLAITIAVSSFKFICLSSKVHFSDFFEGQHYLQKIYIN